MHGNEWSAEKSRLTSSVDSSVTTARKSLVVNRSDYDTSLLNSNNNNNKECITMSSGTVSLMLSRVEM